MAAKPEVLAKAAHLARTPPGLLSSLDKQERFIALLHSQPRQCPWCDAMVTFFEAAPETYTLSGGLPEGERCICPKCSKGLVEIVPLIFGPGPTWIWGKARP